MRAMVLRQPGCPLEPAELPVPTPLSGQMLIRVRACGVCRTDLHVLDGELAGAKLPLVPGHEIVGTVVATGNPACPFPIGARVGVPWLGWTCGTCAFCRAGRENLCPDARFTGYQIDGGYAEYTVADARYCFPIDDAYADVEAAPLLCAGLIGYRALRMADGPYPAGAGRALGIYGFGAAAHIVVQLARHEGARVFAFTRPGDAKAQAFARSLGAVWCGDSDAAPPEPLDAALIFAPAGELVPRALTATAPGGVVVCGGIHMSDIPAFPYALLWHERSLRSVANLTRADAEAFLRLAPRVPVATTTQVFRLADANLALDRLRQGRLTGAAVLVP